MSITRLTVYEVLNIMRFRNLLSLDAPRNPHNPESETLGANVADPGLNPEEVLLAKEKLETIQSRLNKAFLTLTKRERDVIGLRFVEGLGYTEISKRLNISRARVYILKDLALGKLEKGIGDL